MCWINYHMWRLVFVWINLAQLCRNAIRKSSRSQITRNYVNKRNFFPPQSLWAASQCFDHKGPTELFVPWWEFCFRSCTNAKARAAIREESHLAFRCQSGSRIAKKKNVLKTPISAGGRPLKGNILCDKEVFHNYFSPLILWAILGFCPRLTQGLTSL